jgi:5-methylcytosine-specific restriction endonuclease McrA
MKKRIPWNKGLHGLPATHTTKHSEESKKKMSIAKLGKKYPKMSEWQIGHKMPLKTKEALIKANTGSNKGGWKWGDKQKKNLKCFKKGKENPMWKGGISTYERKLFFNKRRRVEKIGNGGFHTQSEWETLKAQCNWTCLCCKKREPIITLSEDHIIPLTKGGSDNIENIQPLCRSCNSKKYTKIIKY